MKKFLRFLLLTSATLVYLPAWASLTVNNAQGAVNISNLATVTISISAGHTVGVWYFSQAGGTTAATVTDSGGNTYTAGTCASQLTNHTTCTAYSLAIATGITSVTVTPPGTATYVQMIVWDVTGTGAISFGGSNGAVTTASTTGANATTTGVIPVSTTDALILGGVTDRTGGQPIVGTGFTDDIQLSGNTVMGEHKAVTTSTAAIWTAGGIGYEYEVAGLSFQVTPPVIVNGALISNGHPVKSGSSLLYQ